MMGTEIETIFTHTTDNGATGELGIDGKGRLYWNRKAVITEQKVSLQWWVNISIIIASLSTLLIAIMAVLNYFYPCIDK
jgi:1,4-dihydroxy-2-naphthoate octaprenyltransferase